MAIQAAEHWFDRATKFLAAGPVPRRSLLHGAALAGVSTLLAKSPAVAAAPNGEVAQRIPPLLPLQRIAEPCTLRYSTGTTTTTFSAESTYRGRPVVMQGALTTSGIRNRSAGLHIRVTYGGQTVFDLSHSALQGRGPNGRRVLASKGAVTYGPVVRGVREVRYLASGNVVTGFMNGRAFSTTTRAPALRFADRRPAPAASVEPGLAAAVRTVAANAARNIGTCRAVRGERPPGPAHRAMAPSSGDVVTRRTLLALAQNGDSSPIPLPLVAQGSGSDPCGDCTNNCDKRFGGCGAGAAGACLATLGFGCIVGVVGCGSDWIDCNNDCNKDGGPCCAQRCAPNNFCCPSQTNCCFDTCCDQNNPVCVNAENTTGGTGYCCPPGQMGCPGVAPPAGVGGMSVIVNTCCPTGSTCCNGACCSQGQYCANSTWGVCCPTGQQWCATGATVSVTNVISGQTSIVNAMACCDGTCLGDAQGNLVCCPQAQVCGSTCCLSGWHCMTTASGKRVCCDHGLCGGELCCGVNDVCTKVVNPRNGQTTYRCAPPGVPCGNTYCGVANPVCCNGVCCASNQTCVNGRCTGPACPPGQVPCPYTPNQCCPPNYVCCGGGPTGHSCCNPATQICCGGRGCLPKDQQCIQ